MNRRSFLASLCALPFVPSALKAERAYPMIEDLDASELFGNTPLEEFAIFSKEYDLIVWEDLGPWDELAAGKELGYFDAPIDPNEPVHWTTHQESL